MHEQAARPSVDDGAVFNVFEQIDKTIIEGGIPELESCLSQLEELCKQFPEDPHFYWRLAMTHDRLFVKTQKQSHVHKGIEVIETALNLKPELANVHKWYAILLGERTHFETPKKKIKDGYLFKEHVEKALTLKPADPTLHFLLGRFAFEVAELKWFERKVASVLFSQPPTATYAEALEHFLEAQRLCETEWKVNLMYIGKCKLKLGDLSEGMRLLERAGGIASTSVTDEDADVEINRLRRRSTRFSAHSLTDLRRVKTSIDSILNENDQTRLESCLSHLEELCMQSPTNPHVMWRLAKVHSRLFVKTEEQQHIHKGIEVIETALNLKPDLANVHKWYAILVGERSQFQPVKKKIKDGLMFKEHVDKAVVLNPSDPTLHFLLGRFSFDLAELNWLEKKMAASLFSSELPQGTYAEALEHFLEAERLSAGEWKMNMMYIGKCMLKLGDKYGGMSILERAEQISSTTLMDNDVDVEINHLQRRSARFSFASIADLTRSSRRYSSTSKFGDLD